MKILKSIAIDFFFNLVRVFWNQFSNWFINFSFLVVEKSSIVCALNSLACVYVFACACSFVCVYEVPSNKYHAAFLFTFKLPLSDLLVCHTFGLTACHAWVCMRVSVYVCRHAWLSVYSQTQLTTPRHLGVKFEITHSVRFWCGILNSP